MNIGPTSTQHPQAPAAAPAAAGATSSAPPSGPAVTGSAAPADALRPYRGRTILVRRLSEQDPVPAITALLHRAYAKQVKMGLRPLAGRQDDSVTRRRIHSGECSLAIDTSGLTPADTFDGAIVGVIILNEIEPDNGPDWFTRPGVASFSQLAVDPAAQGAGIGRALLATVERRAAELGNTELGLSMAEPDVQLRQFYQRSGYRIVATWKWPYTNYLSLILSKSLTPVPKA